MNAPLMPAPRAAEWQTAAATVAAQLHDLVPSVAVQLIAELDGGGARHVSALLERCWGAVEGFEAGRCGSLTGQQRLKLDAVRKSLTVALTRAQRAAFEQRWGTRL